MEFWCRALHHCFTKGWIAMGAIGTLASVVLPFLRQLDPRAAAHHHFWDFVDRYGVAWLCIAVFWLIVGVRFLYAPYWLYAKILRQRDAARSGLTAARNTLKRIPRMTSDFAKLKICFAGDNQTPTPVEMVNEPFYYALAQDTSIHPPQIPTPIIVGSRWAIFITFRIPLALPAAKFFVETNIHPRPEIELKQLTAFGAVVTVINHYSTVPPGLLEMLFRPM